MGFGGVPGIFMGTRCGDIDPFIPLYIMKTQNKSADEVHMMLNKQCGLYALSEGHNDRRDIEALFHQNDPAAVRAMNSYVYQIVKYIGAYIAAMNGVDAIVLPPASVKIPILFAAASAKNWPGWGLISIPRPTPPFTDLPKLPNQTHRYGYWSFPPTKNWSLPKTPIS